MSYEEKGTWVFLVVSVLAYAGYVVAVLSRADGGPLVAVAYVAPLLWSLVASIVASIVVRIVVEIASPSEDQRADERDREFDRRGTLVGWWGIIAGAIGGMVLAMAQAPYFWIANVIYLGFMVFAVLSALVRIRAYRRGV